MDSKHRNQNGSSDNSSPRVRCAIYTRKSTDEGLDQDFNTLDAQRESCESYIASQKSQGWVLVPDRFDDGGFTGANMERPALKRLLAKVEADEVDCILVYKIDRLTRSLLDFSRMIEILERCGATFVAVTQQFNSTTSLGRLTLNILLSFAQFEREMISERTRDKMNAARRKGKWVGGAVVLGYDLAPGGGALVVNAEEAEHVREIYRLYLEFGSLIPLVQELDRRGWRFKSRITREGKQVGGSPFNKTKLHNLLTSVIYTGRIKHQGEIYLGEQGRIVDDATWDAVQERLNRNGRRGGRNVRNKHGALLKALVRCESCGVSMTHTYTNKKGKVLYRYYVCENARQKGWAQCETRSVSAPALEGAVLQQLCSIAQDPAVLSEVLDQLERQRREGGRNTPMADPDKVKEALTRFDPLWEHFTSWERESFIRSLISQVRFDGRTSKVTVTFRSEGLKQLCTLNVKSGSDGNA